MKKGIVAILALAMGMSLQAQKNVITEQKKLTLITGSIGVANATSSGTTTQGRICWGLGAEQLFLLNKHFIFNVKPGLNLRGYKSGGTKVNALYLDVPVVIEYAFNTEKNGWFIGAGLYGGIALTGSYSGNNLKLGEGSNDNRSRTDYGFQLSLGTYSFSLGKWTLALNGGLKNVIPQDRQTGGNSIKLHSATSTIAIPLSIFKKGGQ